MGSISRADGGDIRQGPAGLSRRGPPVVLPQTSPWPEATAAEAGEWGEGQPRLHCEATGKEERQYITPPSEPCRHEGYGTASPLAVIGPQPAASLYP